MIRLLHPPTTEEIERASRQVWPIRTRTDLYERVSRRLMHRAMEKYRRENAHGEDDPTQELRWCEMISAIAFVMQLARYRNHVVPQGEIPGVMQAARERCSQLVQTHWDADWKMLPKTEFTDRGMLTGDGQLHLGFRDLKKMEFYAAWFLTRFAVGQNHPAWDDLRRWRPERDRDNLNTEVEPSASDPPSETAMNSDEWRQVWLRVLEFAEPSPREPFAVRCASLPNALGLLFERPAGGRRPSELMYHAWLLFQKQPALQKPGQEILTRFQREPIDILTRKSTELDRPWPEQIPRGEPGEPMQYVDWTDAQLLATLIPEHRVLELIEKKILTAQRWKQIAPPDWGWFLSSRRTERDGYEQLQAWRAAGYRQEWDDPVTGKRNLFKYEDRAFVPCPPVEFAELMEQSLREERDKKGRPIWTDAEIRARVDAIRHDPCSYMRGRDSGDSYGSDDEHPRHRVRFTPPHTKDGSFAPPFWMQATVVTRSQFALFDPAIKNDSLDYMPEPDCPALHVNWWDSLVFGLFLHSMTVIGLPSEAQWEGAARAGRDFAGPAVDVRSPRFERYGIAPYEVISHQHANYDGKIGRTLSVRWNRPRHDLALRSSTAQQSIEKLPQPFLTNLWGIWHAHGNVWEWCQDEYKRGEYWTYDYSKDEVVAPVRNSDLANTARVLRGGAWSNGPTLCRSAIRLGNSPVNRVNYAGLRLVCVGCVRTS